MNYGFIGALKVSFIKFLPNILSCLSFLLNILDIDQSGCYGPRPKVGGINNEEKALKTSKLHGRHFRGPEKI